jgi:hypothetical protein
MATQPWFKFYASDYLLNGKVDNLPLEAQTILLRMWCLCHIEGACPAQPGEIARKVRLSAEKVSEHIGALRAFFESREGRLFSHRMEAEKAKSEIARQNGKKRGQQIRSAVSSAACSSSGSARCDSDSGFSFSNPPPVKRTLSTLEENARAREARGKPKYDAAVGLQIDWRKWCKARNELQLKLSSGWGAELSDEQLFHEQCVLAGVTAEVGRELANRALGASA